ncbi:MAG TPA: TIGR01777 family oxidoreductase [Bryobacteraceae bacterium]|nr:TIGR01777 family oxidoreductase [Bryobacteraceae bacterium]
MNITISGASGFIGRRLLHRLGAGHSLHVLSRHAGTNLPAGVRLSVWNPLAGPPPEESLRDAGAVIHLAGESVAQRWTPEAKRRIRESRVTGTRNLVEGMAKLTRPPAVLVCASAVGYYGSRGDEELTEDSPAGSGFLAELCQEWEAAARSAEPLGVRVVHVRIGIVLDPRGGALPKMLPPFRWGVGGRLGSGTQWFPWIHLDDLASLFRYAVENQVSGALNGVAPNPVTNAEFTKELAQALGRPAWFPVPVFALKILFGEMGEALLVSERVLPRRAEAAGFRFQYPRLPEALSELLRTRAAPR